MAGLKLTKHFRERWFERVGSHPTEAAVMAFIAGAIKVQDGRNVKLADGSDCRILAIFWHPELDLMIKVDEVANRAVTVMTPACWGRRKNDGGEVLAKCGRPSHVPAARVARVKAMFGKGLVFA